MNWSKNCAVVLESGPEMRKKWKKFGKARDSLNSGITTISHEDIFLDTSESVHNLCPQSKKDDFEKLWKTYQSTLIEKWIAHKFDPNNEYDLVAKEVLSIIEQVDKQMGEKAEDKVESCESEKVTVYKHPNNSTRYDDSSSTIKIYGFTSDVNESEVREIVGTYGKIRRFNILKDHQTGVPKELGFISYYDPEIAAKACQQLNGYRYGNVVWTVTMARN